jgi:hypothetical protein
MDSPEAIRVRISFFEILIALDVSFSSQNCNSLNVSTSVRNQAAKIVSILDLGTDIIFLSDTRLNGRHKSIIDAFRSKYRMYHHKPERCGSFNT